MLVKAARNHSSGGEVTGKNGPATESEPVTYALNTEFQPCELCIRSLSLGWAQLGSQTHTSHTVYALTFVNRRFEQFLNPLTFIMKVFNILVYVNSLVSCKL